MFPSLCCAELDTIQMQNICEGFLIIHSNTYFKHFFIDLFHLLVGGLEMRKNKIAGCYGRKLCDTGHTWQ